MVVKYFFLLINKQKGNRKLIFPYDIIYINSSMTVLLTMSINIIYMFSQTDIYTVSFF